MISPRLNRRHCSTFYEHAGISSPTTIAGVQFAGVVQHGTGSSPHAGVFDTPLFDDANVTDDAQLIGRLMGSFWPHVAETGVDDEGALNSGLWNFYFFEEESWISASLGFGPNNSSANTPNVITGGTGEFSSYIGTVEHVVVNDDRFVIEYTVCPPPPSAAMEIVAEACVDIYAWDSSQQSVIGNHSFTGDVFRGADSHVGVLDNPFFDTLEAAQNGQEDTVKGRNLGVYFPDSLQTTTAAFNFEFFGDSNVDEGEEQVDWIATSFGFSFDTPLSEVTSNEQPNVIIGGSGKYSRIVGTIEDTVEEFAPTPEGEFAEVNYYKICSDNDPFPDPIVEEDCTVVFELSTPHSLSIESYNFSGSALAGEDDHLGLFNTPFFFSQDVENSTLAGRVMGHYFVNGRGAATGQWNFHFFGSEGKDGTDKGSPTGWLTGNLGFGEGDFPDVIVGGTGDWKGFNGRVRPTPLIIDDSFIIKWTICPEGKGFAGGKMDIDESIYPTEESPTGDPTPGEETLTAAPADKEMSPSPTSSVDMASPMIVSCVLALIFICVAM